MIIEHIEPFQAWLAIILKPLCDADPGALAKYVVALIKKDLPENELRQSMIDQLDVFLQSETKPFVDKMFEALNTNEHMNCESLSPSEEAVLSAKSESGCSDGNASGNKYSKADQSSLTLSLLWTSESDLISSTSGPTSSMLNQTPVTSSLATSSFCGGGEESDVQGTAPTSSLSSKKGSNTLSVTPSTLLNKEAIAGATSSSHGDSEEENTSSKTSSSSSSRQTKQSDKIRRKCSRTERDRRGSRMDRATSASTRSRSSRLNPNRNWGRGPLRRRLGRTHPPHMRYDRDIRNRRRSRSPLGSRNRSFSPKNNNRSRSPLPPRYRRGCNAIRSRSRSPLTRGREGSRSPRIRSPHNKNTSKNFSKRDSLLPIPPVLDTSLSKKDLGDKARPITMQSVVVRPGNGEGSHQSADHSQSPSGDNCGNNRCRDFDEKGFCMRGELCPFDHGKDPVVLEEIVRAGGGPGCYGAVGGGLVSGAPSYNPPLRPTMMGEYYPDSPSLEAPVGWGPGAPPFRPRHMGFSVAGRGGRRGLLFRPSAMGPYPVPRGNYQLISLNGIPGIPSTPCVPHRGPPPGMPSMPVHLGPRGVGPRGGHCASRGGFDYGRLGPKLPHHNHHPHKDYTNCSLEVRKIPREQNTIMDLNRHFCRFGKIINIQINYDNDSEAALVTFSTPAEAQMSYSSTEAVLNNRFIRVFWHKEKENERNEEEAETLKKVLQEQKQAEALKMSNDLRKRQHTMMVEQIGQQKKLIALLEGGSLSVKEKEETIRILKVLQDSVTKLKKNLDESNRAKPQFHHQQVTTNKMPMVVSKNALIEGTERTPCTKEEALKEMLDAELDLINKELGGGDTIDLQNKLLHLRSRAKSFGLIGQTRGRGGYRGLGRGFGRARGMFRGRGRGRVRSLRNVDRRSTKIQITCCPAARLPDILAHFSEFGPIRDYVSDSNVPMMILDFDSRKCAELAMANGHIFEDMKLNLEWVTEGTGEGGKSGGGTLMVGMGNGESVIHHEDLDNSETSESELGDILNSEIILTGEDEEDGDDRSWRR